MDTAGPRDLGRGDEEELESSPDFQMAVTRSDGQLRIVSLGHKDLRPLPGPLESRTGGMFWSADSRSLFIYEEEGLTWRIFRRDIATGRRERWLEATPSDPAGFIPTRFNLAGDGKSYAYSYRRTLDNLYLVDGLR